MSSEYFLGQLQLFAISYVPSGWAPCNGQLLPIQQYQALFSLLGTNFGGNGQTTFGLPNLQGRTPVGLGNGIQQLGQTGGEEAHTLTQGEVPPHGHGLQASTKAPTQGGPSGNFLATTAGTLTIYKKDNTGAPQLNAGTISVVGGQPHENRQPYLVMTWCIALTGIFPSRS